MRSAEDLVLQLDGGTAAALGEAELYIEALGFSLSGPFVGTMDWGIGRRKGAGRGRCEAD